MFRILTLVLTTLLCLVAMGEGWDIVRFSLVARGDGDRANPESFRAWADVSGLSFDARDAALTAIANTDGEGRSGAIQDQLSKILSIKPVSSGYWLSLARMRFADKTNDEGMQAFSLSVLTGANEGNVMPWRAILGLSLWESAPAEVKSRAIADLASALPYINGQHRVAIQRALEGKNEDLREHIRSLLLAAGAPSTQLPAIGLAAK